VCEQPLSVAEPEAIVTGSVTEVTEPTTDEPTTAPRNYFDVPLSYDVQDHIFTECERHNISPAVIIAMIDRESKFNTYALGDDGRSAGLMQIQAKWHLQRMIDLNCTDLFDPQQNITVGIDILAELLQRYDDDIAKALTAYNRGSYSGTITSYAKEILNNAEKH
jgi:soluble lytic murein transglycosylase-like protein